MCVAPSRSAIPSPALIGATTPAGRGWWAGSACLLGPNRPAILAPAAPRRSPSFHDGRKDVLTDATLVAEVLSPSTEGYDRGGKFALYRALPGLRQYLLIAQDRLAVDVFSRQPDRRWVLDAYTDPDACVPLESVGRSLLLRDLYDKVELSA